MRIKDYAIIGIILLVIAGGVIFYNRTKEKPEAILFPYSEVELPGTSKIIMKQKSLATELSRNDQGQWTIASGDHFPADELKIGKLLRNLANEQVIQLMTSDHSKFDEYKEKNSSEFALYQGSREIMRAIVGKPRRGGGQYFVFPDLGAVYLIRNVYRMEPDEIHWQRKRLWQADFTEVQGIVVYGLKDKPVFAIRRGSGIQPWIATVGRKTEEVNNLVVNRILRPILMFQYARRHDSSQQEGIEAMINPRRLAIELADGSRYLFLAGIAGKPPQQKFFTKFYASLMTGKSDPTIAARHAELNRLMSRWVYETTGDFYNIAGRTEYRIAE